MHKAVRRAMPYSKCGEKRLWTTFAACRKVDADKIPGVFVECGVWRGGNVIVARWASPLRQCWLYDTFDGMTEPGPLDLKKNGESALDRFNAKKAAGNKWAECSADEVRANLAKEKVYDAGLCKFIVGDVRDTLRSSDNLPERIAVLRLDTDWYDSTKIEMEILYPRLAVGGVLIVDDYGHWMGARKAVADYLGKSNKLTKIDKTGAWMVKEK